DAAQERGHLGLPEQRGERRGEHPAQCTRCGARRPRTGWNEHRVAFEDAVTVSFDTARHGMNTAAASGPGDSDVRDAQPLASAALAEDLSNQAHRRVIGFLGLILPWTLLLLAALRPTKGLPTGPPLDSLSSYYYTGAVAFFVGVVFSLSLFLFTYRGYKGV